MVDFPVIIRYSNGLEFNNVKEAHDHFAGTKMSAAIIELIGIDIEEFMRIWRELE